MKLNLAILATLAGLLALSSAGLAQDTNATRRANRGPTLQQRVDGMTKELKLNDDQKAKVTALFEKERKDRREIMADRDVPRDELRSKMRALAEEQNKQLKVILTPEQYEKWQTLREQMRPRGARGPRGPSDGAEPAPAPAPAPTPAPKDNNQAK